jgi:hypothetical protein
MKFRWLNMLLLLVMAGGLLAQEPVITPQTPVDDGVFHQWLHSGEPRLIAWAATFARVTHNAKIIAEMPALLEHWTIPRSDARDEAQKAQLRAASAVLDTLIQENAKVPIPAIDAVAQYFPYQSIILMSRLPLSESRLTLHDWTYGATGSWSGRTLARVASMMLAKDPGGVQEFWNGNLIGFVASVVAASEEELHITISSTDTRHDSAISVACGDSIAREVTPGWPQVYTYDLVENDPQVSAPVVVDLDGDRIVSRRLDLSLGWGSCYGVQWLDSSTRHRLIAYWLGVKNKEMTWQPVERFTIVWTDETAYQKQLGEIIEAQRKKLRATVEALHQKGLLTEGEAARVAPRLIVTVHCEIKPCPLN